MTTCPCQWGPSAHCLHGAHDRCRAHIPTAYPATWITDSDGQVWGLNHAQVQVWHADRVCRWICRCDCHTVPAEPETEAAAADAEIGVLVVRRPGVGEAHAGRWWAYMRLGTAAILHVALVNPAPETWTGPPVRMLLGDAVRLLRAAGYVRRCPR